MMEHSFEKLYLSKDVQDSKKDIFVDKCPLVQHQLDGIRFLYRALKKNKRGVILNDPSGYGKRVQTALFLSAILPTLKKPVLILCREGKEQRWKRHFQEWTAVSDDVSIELDNPLVKKKVVISVSYGAAVFARREWSVLVLDDDLMKDVLKASLRAELRVWITSSNIKEDLSKFATFHSWIHPKEKFVADQYKADKRNLRDVLTKAAMLDACLEGTVLRRNNGEPPFCNNQVYKNDTEARITKKNKDATGTKIKRSKRKSVDTTTEENPNKVARTKNTVENTVVPSTSNHKVKSIKTARATESATEIFEIGGVNDDDFAPLRQNTSKQSRVLQWESDTEDEQIDITHISQVDNIEYQNNSELDSDGQSKVLYWNGDTDGEDELKDSRLDVGKIEMNCKPNEVSKTELPTVANDEIDIANVEDELETQILETIPKNNMKDKINPINSIKLSEDLFSTDFTKNDMDNEISTVKIIPLVNNVKFSEDLSKDLTKNYMYNEISTEKLIIPIANNVKFSEDLFSTDLTKNDMDNEISTEKIIPIVNNVKFSEDLSMDLNTNPVEEIYESNDMQDQYSTKKDLKDNVNLQETNRSKENEKNKKTDQNSLENANLSSFELKLKQMEELALKKFKGSFLDSIF